MLPSVPTSGDEEGLHRTPIHDLYAEDPGTEGTLGGVCKRLWQGGEAKRAAKCSSICARGWKASKQTTT